MWVEFFSVALQRNDISKTKIDIDTSSDYPVMLKLSGKILTTFGREHIFYWFGFLELFIFKTC